MARVLPFPAKRRDDPYEVERLRTSLAARVVRMNAYELRLLEAALGMLLPCVEPGSVPTGDGSSS